MLGVAFTLFPPHGDSRSLITITGLLRNALDSLTFVDPQVQTALITTMPTELESLFSKVVHVLTTGKSLCGASTTGVKGQNWQLRVLMWQHTPFEHTLFVDSDTTFCFTPRFALQQLIANHVDIGYKVHFKRGSHPDNGAMYIRMTPATRSFMDRWYNMTCGVDDQSSFYETMVSVAWSIEFTILPNTVSARYLPAVKQGWMWNTDRFKDHTMALDGPLISFHDPRRRNRTAFCAMVNNNTGTRILTYTDAHPDRLAWDKRQCDQNINGSCRDEWEGKGVVGP